VALVVRTAHLSKGGEHYLDITRAGAERSKEPGGHRGIGAAFAPSRGLLNWGLNRRDSLGLLTDAAWIVYSRNYIKEMRESYKAKRPSWDLLLAMPEVTLCCACKDPVQCHRAVLARDILRKFPGVSYAGER
jgi:uncharacterized protein YeaO (DUF488 family)